MERLRRLVDRRNSCSSHFAAIARGHIVASMLIGVLVGVSGRLAYADDPGDPAPLSASPKSFSDGVVAEVEAQFQADCRAIPVLDGKSRCDKEFRILLGLVRDKCGRDSGSLRALGRVLIDKTRERHLDDAFRENLYCAVIEVLADNGHRDALVELLAQKYPRTLRVQTPTEFYLAVLEYVARNEGEKVELRDGIFVVLDAYERARDTANRQAILKGIRKAFSNIDPTGTDDAGYILKCRQWYLANRDRIDINPEYGIPDNGPLFLPSEGEVSGENQRAGE